MSTPICEIYHKATHNTLCHSGPDEVKKDVVVPAPFLAKRDTRGLPTRIALKRDSKNVKYNLPGRHSRDTE